MSADMSTDLVPATNMSAVEALGPEAQALAVTTMLNEAHSWLAHAVEASDPATIATFKAQMATVAEATKQLGLSKGIQLNAQEMVRRFERRLGTAIREGQEEGTVETPQETYRRATLTREVNQGRADRTALNGSIKPRPLDYATEGELSGNGAGIFQMTDNVSDEQFEDAITEAKAEENMSRANVVRKTKAKGPDPQTPAPFKSRAAAAARRERIREMAGQAYTTRQIAKTLNVGEQNVREVAKKHGIEITADKVMRKTHRHDSNRIVNQVMDGLEGTRMAIELIDYDALDRGQAAHWATSLDESLQALNHFRKKIKELTQ